MFEFKDEDTLTLTIELPLLLTNPLDFCGYFDFLKNLEELSMLVNSKIRCLELVSDKGSKLTPSFMEMNSVEQYNDLFAKLNTEIHHPRNLYKIEKVSMESPIKIVITGLTTFVISIAALSTIAVNYEGARGVLGNPNSALRQDIELLVDGGRDIQRDVSIYGMRKSEALLKGLEATIHRNRLKIKNHRKKLEFDKGDKNATIYNGDSVKKIDDKYEVSTGNEIIIGDDKPKTIFKD